MMIALIGAVLLCQGIWVHSLRKSFKRLLRQKEFLADASSAQYTRNPQGIKSALQKIAQKSNAYRANETNAPSQLTYLTHPKPNRVRICFSCLAQQCLLPTPRAKNRPFRADGWEMRRLFNLFLTRLGV